MEDLLKEKLYKIIDKKNLFLVLLKDKEQKSNDFINIYTKRLRDEIIYLFTKLIFFWNTTFFDFNIILVFIQR